MSSSQPVKSLPSKILVADDDDGVRAGLVANLEMEGYQVAEARDGAEAIRLLAGQSFDLVVADVVMPAATGVEVLSAVRKQRLVTPFILISAFVSEELVTRALGEGLFAMLYKPFAMDRILEVVARALKPSLVLLVDDPESSVAPLATALRDVGMGVQTCENNASALAFARDNLVDVCVLDLQPEALEESGVCEALHAINPRMDIVAITGSANAEQVRGLAQRGVTTCLRKPFDVRALLTAIARVRAATPVRK